MEPHIIFRGEWLRDCATRKNPTGNWFPDVDLSIDHNGIALVFLLVFGLISLLISLLRWISRNRAEKESSVSKDSVELNAELLRFVSSPDGCEQHVVNEISALELHENSDCAGESTSVILLTLNDNRRVYYRFKAATIGMQSQLHQLIGIWRSRISRVIHLRSGSVVPAWNSDCG